MTLSKYISFVPFFVFFFILSINSTSANTYTSEIFSSLSRCESQKEKNNSLYPSFYRSDCVEAQDGKFHYNICDTNYCVTNIQTNQLKEIKDPGVYQYDRSNTQVDTLSTNYQLDDQTQQHIEKIAANLENRFQKMSQSDLEQWNDNFLRVIEKLSEKSKNNEKNIALIKGIKQEVQLVIEKQKQENDLCKNQYGSGWKEASFFFESNNMVTWIEGNKKHSLACEYIETKKDDIDVKDKGEIDEYNPPVVTDEPENKTNIDKSVIKQGSLLTGFKGESCLEWLNRIGKNGKRYSALLDYGENKEKSIQNRCAYMVWQNSNSSSGEYKCTSASINFKEKFSNNLAYPVTSCKNNTFTAYTLVDDKKLMLDENIKVSKPSIVEIPKEPEIEIIPEDKLISMKASMINGNILNLSWNIHKLVDVTHCKTLNINVNKLTHNGKIKIQSNWNTTTTTYAIVCKHPQVSGDTIKAIAKYYLPSRYVSLSSNKKSIKKGDKVKINWKYDGGNNAMIFDINRYNSISGKSYKYLLNRDTNFIYKNGKINPGHTGNMYVTPYFPTTYMLVLKDSSTHSLKTSFIDIQVDGKEVQRDESKINSIIKEYESYYLEQNKKYYSDVQIHGKCQGSFRKGFSINIPKTYNKDLFTCGSGKFSGFKSTKISNGTKYYWTCEGTNLGSSQECEGILLK